MPNAAESAAQKLAWEMESWKSIEIRFHEDFVNKDPARKPDEPRTFRSTDHYIETAAGQRVYDTRMTTELEKGTGVSIEYTDGSKCAQLLRTDEGGVAGQEQVTIKRSFYCENDGVTYRPDPLKYLYVGLKPLHEDLARAEHLGEGRRLDRPCDRFVFTQVNGKNDQRHLVYWLDRETGITLRFEYYDDAKLRSGGRPDHVWNAQSLDDVGGRHLVMRSQVLQLDPEGTDPQRVLVQYDVITDEVVFDRDYPKSTFWPAVTKGTKVFDMIANKVIMPQRKPGPRATTATPIRAIDPDGWGLSYSTVGLLLGAAALLAGLLLWWRRR